MKKLSKKTARLIAYSAIHAWTSEHARSDSQFFEIDRENAAAYFGGGFDPHDAQHVEALVEAFEKIDAMVWKRLSVMMTKNLLKAE